MPSFFQVTAAAALLALGTAAPVEKIQKRSFQVHQTANPKFAGHNGKAALAHAIAKYAPYSKVKTHSDIDSGSVTATPEQYDSEYLCPVTIGGQDFSLDFDTGSSDLWVFGQGVSGRQSTYQPTGAAKPGEAWSISYGDGSSAGGKVYSDTVAVGPVSVTGQAVEAATSASSEFTSGAPDGLLGLAFSTINTVTTNGRSTPQNTFFDNAVAQGLDAVFAANLKAGTAGSYDFGALDNSAFSGDIAYTDVDDSQGFWMFTPDQGDAGIADTGTTLMLLSDDTVSNYYSQVNGAQNDQSAGGYVFDCNANLPDFSITVAGYTATVPGKFINYAPADNTGSSKFDPHPILYDTADEIPAACFGGIQSDSSIGFAIYGDVFLKSQYVVFDKSQGSPRLGLAPKA